MMWLLLTTSSRSFGGYVQLQAPHSNLSARSLLESCHHDVEKIVFVFLQNNDFGNMTSLLLTTSSSSFGGFVQLRATTAVLQEGVYWNYATMISKKIVFVFVQNNAFDKMTSLLLTTSSRSFGGFVQLQAPHSNPSARSLLESCHHDIEKIVFVFLQNKDFANITSLLLTT